MKIRKVWTYLVLAGSLLGTGLIHPAAHAMQRGGIVRIVSVGEPQLLNPVFDQSPEAQEMYNLIYSGLISENSRSELEPDLVQTVPTTNNGMVQMLPDGGMTVTYRLRPGLKWQDGQTLSSEDILFTWQAHTDPQIKYPPTPGYEKIRRVEVLDDLTARVHFHEAYGNYYQLFRYLLPRHSFRSKHWNFSPEHPYNKHPVGSGPFVLENWTPGQSALLNANPLYHRGRPNLDQIRYTFKPESYRTIKTAINWVDDAELIRGMSLASYDYLKNRPDLDLHVVATGQIEHMLFNTQNDTLSDRRVRRALAYATDRRAISDLLLGLAEPAYSDQLKDSWKYNSVTENYYQPSLDEARSKLEAAGWKQAESESLRNKDGQPLKLEMTLIQGNRSHIVIGKYLQESWQKIGVELTLKFVAPQIMHDDILPKGDYQLAFATWNQDSMSNAYSRWHSTQTPPKGHNYTHFSDYQVDMLTRELQGTVNLKQQKLLYKQLATHLVEEVPVLPLFYGAMLEGNKTSLHNYASSAYRGATWNAYAWWVE